MADSNKAGNTWGWFGLIAIIALVGIGFLYQREGGKLFGPWSEGRRETLHSLDRVAAPASGTESGVSSQFLQETTGSLEISVSGTLYPGWLFINGELQGKLPYRKEHTLAPGIYEVRCIQFEDREFTTIFGKVQIEASKKSSCTIEFHDGGGGRVDIPGGFVFGPAKKWPVELAIRDPKANDSDATKRKILEQHRSSLEKGLKDFQNSEEWQSLTAAAAQLLSSPRMDSAVWMQLPETLGGTRYVDREQMQYIREGVKLQFWNYVGDSERGVGRLSRTAGAPAGSAEVAEFIRKKRQDVEGLLDKMVVALEVK